MLDLAFVSHRSKAFTRRDRKSNASGIGQDLEAIADTSDLLTQINWNGISGKPSGFRLLQEQKVGHHLAEASNFSHTLTYELLGIVHTPRFIESGLEAGTQNGERRLKLVDEKGRVTAFWVGLVFSHGGKDKAYVLAWASCNLLLFHACAHIAIMVHGERPSLWDEGRPF